MNLDKPESTPQPMPDPFSTPTTAALPMGSAVPPALPETVGQVSRFRFVGTASEYFGIWIVNILLTIITIGFYAPWAKVRRLRYFYGHTVLAKEVFDFTGIPTKILLGRIIAGVVYITALVITNIDPNYAWAFPILILLVLPWLLRATYRFNARNSKYRNSRFYFSGSNKGAYKTYLWWTLLSMLSLGLLFPYAFYKHKQYQFRHLQVGQLPFTLTVRWQSYYAAMAIPLIIIVVAGLALALTAPMLLAAMFPVLLLVVPYIQGALYRTTWAHTLIGDSPFQCDLNPLRYAWIVLSNWFARILSFGLLSPWAAVREHRYKVESLSIFWQDDPAYLLTLAQQDPSAFGEELSDILDIDVSL
ncbi:MAG: YjgN family protein [Pseudomonadota bacterium]|nr:YjgN family protein [Pseudomonadota bacterium]